MDHERQIARLERRLQRETQARLAAEDMLEKKAAELFAINKSLQSLNRELEDRVIARTADLNEQRKAAEVLARTDHLTGVGNRLAFSAHLPSMVAEAGSGGRQLALLSIDLDGFKQVNDTWGHDVGDKVLQCTAKRLVRGCRDVDRVFRLGGDEFAVVLAGQVNPTDVGTRLMASLTEPIPVGDNCCTVGISMGIAQAPIDTLDYEQLMIFADSAAYAAKTRGGGLVFFDRDLERKTQARSQLQQDLQTAIANRDIEAWLQPIVSAADGRVVGAEALARWRGSDGKLISPATFIPLAEQCGLVHDIGMAVLEKSAETIRPLCQEGSIDYVSVNLSPVQMSRPALVSEILASLEKVGLPPHNLVLEITESVLLSETENVRSNIWELASKNIEFALDDFGVGYSNMRYLQELPLSKLKIDRSFVTETNNPLAAARIIEAMTALAHKFELKVVAEGIETAAQLDKIKGLNCDLAQGFLCGRPMPREEFVEWVQGRQSISDRRERIKSHI